VLEADEQGRARVGESKPYQKKDQYTKTYRLSADTWQLYPELLDLARDAAPIARQVMNVPAVRLYADRLFIKPPTREGGVPTLWHQDLPKLPFDRRENVTLWVAVADIPAEKGPLTFLSRSHRLGPLTADSYESDEELFARLSGYERSHLDIVEVPLRAGDATLHAGLTVHRAGANVSTEERLAWSLNYISADTLFNGVPHRGIEGLDLVPFKTFDHPKFPIFQ
jgi:ectoine hydroxylase-related dioxygenase (phytanoyl-CoA dioxygenase family)